MRVGDISNKIVEIIHRSLILSTCGNFIRNDEKPSLFMANQLNCAPSSSSQFAVNAIKQRSALVG